MSNSNLVSQPNQPGRILTDIGIITRRNLLLTLRLPAVLAFSTLQPVTTLLLFNYVLGGALVFALPPAAGGNYLNWLIPGLLAQYGIFSGGQTGAGIADDLTKGVIDRFRSLPMARSAVLAGRTLADLLRTALVLTLLVAVGVGIGFRPQTGLIGILAALLISLSFSYAWSWVMVVVGLVVRSVEAIQVVGYLLFFPLTFASSAFVPAGTMPAGVRWFTANQPVSVVTNASRGLMFGQGALAAGQSILGQAGLALLWAAAITLVCVPLAVRLYRQATS